MSEKRFERWNDHSCKVKDNQEDTLLNWEGVVKKLNEQQSIIDEQKIVIDEMITDYKNLEKENEQLKKGYHYMMKMKWISIFVHIQCQLQQSQVKEESFHWICDTGSVDDE